MTSTVHGQLYSRACGSILPPGQGTPTPGTGTWGVVPSLCVSERYDTNVYFAPKTSATSSLRFDDFVNDVVPSVRVNHNGNYASGYVNAGAFGETYVYNTGLNYVGFTGNLDLNLDNSVKRLLPNASLQVIDFGRYTPVPPGFVNPAAGTSPSAPVNSQNAFAQGILAYRTNTLTNVVNVISSYAISPLTSLKASYSNSIIRYGSSQVPTGAGQFGTLFNSTVNSESVGGSTRLSELDVMSLTYIHSDIAYTSATTQTFQTDSASLGWSRTLTPTLKSELGGGGILINPGLTSWVANAALILTLPNNRATLSYARTAFPSVVGTATPVIGNLVSLSAIQDLSSEWQLTERASFIQSTGATSSTNSGSTKVQFTTYTASVDLYYWMTRIWSTGLSFDYQNYDSESAGTKYAFNRYVITFGVKATLE
jgi:hypothetical protein